MTNDLQCAISTDIKFVYCMFLFFLFNQYLKRKPHSLKGAFQEGPQDYNVFTIYIVIYNNNKIETK